MKYLLTLIVLIAVFASGEALKCYECLNPPNSKCGDPFDKSMQETSFDPPCVCMKTVIVLTNATYTARGCGTPSLSPMTRGLPDSNMFVSFSTNFCHTDLCNGASAITAALSTLMAFTTLLVFANWN